MWPFRSENVALSPFHKALIEKYIWILTDETKNFEDLLRYLEAAGLLNIYEISLIMKHTGKRTRNFHLYNTILTKGPDSFKTLTKGLLSTKNELMAARLHQDLHELRALDAEAIREKLEAEEIRRQKLDNQFDTALAKIPQNWCALIASVLLIVFSGSIPIVFLIVMIKACLVWNT